VRLWLLACVLVAVSANGQDAPRRPAPPSAGPALAPATAPAYTYNADGRRDPFVSLLRRARESGRRGDGKSSDGVRGLLINEVALKGVLVSRTDRIALVLGPDNKTYLVRASDRFLDGFVRAVTADSLVLVQDVNDPLSVTKQREVRKKLRAAVEQK